MSIEDNYIESEQKFQSIFNSTFSFIGFLDVEGILLEANQTALEMAGITAKDVIGKKFWDCYWWQISQEAQQKLKESFKKAAQGSEIVYETEVWVRDQTPLTILFSMRPIFDQQGQVKFIVPEGRPIQDIVDSRNRLKAVVEGTNAGTWEWNVQTGETIFNERWAEIVGYKLEELEPISIKTWEKLAHPEDLMRSNKLLQDCFDKKREFYEAEVRMKHKKGHWVWVYDKGKVISWNQDGKPLKMYGTHQDISEKKKFEEQLKISERAFRGNFENAAIGMAILNEKGQWLNVNQKVCDIVGYTENELKKLTFQDITHPEDLDKDLAYMNELIKGERDQYQMEKRYFHKDGHIVHIILAAAIVRDLEGNILYFISQIIDISDLKKAEQIRSEQLEKIQSLLNFMEQQNEQLKSFSHIVSHNLRSQVTGISLNLELIRDEHPELLKDEMFPILLKASERLTNTLKDLNEIVEISSSIEAQLKILPLQKILDQTIEGIRILAHNTAVSIINDIPKHIKVKAIPAYLESIILNFITNGIRYRSEKRDSFIRISAIEDDEFTVITFTDNGLGIDLEQNRENLFGMFNTFHDHPESRGIGLYITKNQIEAMGGYIDVESKPGEGTSFHVFLPVP